VTALWWAALRDRFGTAAMTFVLAMLAAGFAAAGPTYESAALRAVREAEVAQATVDELVIEATKVAPHKDIDRPPPLPHVPGMRTVHGRFIGGEVQGLPESPGRLPGTRRQTALESRSGLCEHLPVVSGRCPTAGNEVAARRDMGLRPGQDLTFTYLVDKEVHRLRLTVVGLYDFLDIREPYWSRHDELIGSGFSGALVTTEQTMALVFGPMIERVDLVAAPDAFTGDIPSILEDVNGRLTSGTYMVNTEILRLHDRLEHSREMLRDKLTAAVVPLVLTCWFVLFLAVAGAIRQRREELGLGALRGVPAWLRWVLPAMETALPVLAGAIPGYLLGLFAVSMVTEGAEVTQASMTYAALAIGGALLAGLIAQAAILSTPVNSLLRRVTRRGRSTRGSVWRTLELMTATFAIALGYQAIVSGEEARGLAMLAPLCLAVGLGIVAARFTAHPAESLGRRALRRGRINLGMSLLTLGRRSGHAATVVLLTVVIGMVGFAAVSAVSLRAAWQERAVTQSAAPRVLTVAPVTTALLLNAVRAADPGGTQAMAAARLEASDTGWILAVDSQRLPAVAHWPANYGSLSAQEVSRLLRPRPPEPVVVNGENIKVRLGLELADPKAAVRITVRLVDSGGVEVLSRSPDLSPGTKEYVLKATECAARSCHLDSIEIIVIGDNGTKGRLTMAGLAGNANWHAVGVKKIERADDGLRVDFESAARVEMRVFPSVMPDPVPLVSSAAPPQRLSSHTNTLFYNVLDAGRMAVTPRVGVGGHLIDLEYATLGATGTTHTDGEVWLAPGASNDVVDRLRANGLTILDDRTTVERRDLLQRQAPALTLRFLVLAGGAMLLVGAAGLLVIAALERSRPEDGLGVLRGQGLGERTIAASALGARVVMLGVALVAGLAATAGSWLLVRRVMPPFIDDEWHAALPSAADVPVPAALAACGIAVLALAGWLAARVSNKESERP